MKSTLLKLMILSMMIMSSLSGVTASSLDVGVAMKKIISIEGSLDVIEVDYDESIPLPYASLQEMLDDNANFTIHTNSYLSDISLAHDRDEIHYGDPDPLYVKYKRYYVLTDENDDTYELIQMIHKRTSDGDMVLVVATVSKEVSLYHSDDDLSDYNGGILFNNSNIMNYLESYFPQMSSILNQYCNAQSTMTYVDEILTGGNINERCYTMIRRTHYIDRECGVKYRYVAVVNFKVLHYNQTIQVSGVMDTLRIKEGQSLPQVVLTVQSLKLMNNNISIQANSVDRIELIHVGDQYVSSIPGRKYYTRTYRLKDKCDESVSADITQSILENGTVLLGTAYHDVYINHEDDNITDYKDGSLYAGDVIDQYLNAFFSEGLALLEQKCPGAAQTLTYDEVAIGNGDISERCSTVLQRTHTIERENDGITYRYVAVLNLNVLHYNEEIISLGSLQKIRSDYDDPKPVPYSNTNELLSKNPTMRIEAAMFDKLVLTSYDEVVVEDENKKEYLRHYTVKDKCDESIKVEITQEILLTDVIVVSEQERKTIISHEDDDLRDYDNGSLYDEEKLYSYLSMFSYDEILDEYCDNNEQYLSYTDTQEGEGPVEERCSTLLKRVFNIDRVCGDVIYRFIARLDFEVIHYNDIPITFNGGDRLKEVKIDGWDSNDVPKYNTFRELLDDNPNISVDKVTNFERLVLKSEEDKLLVGNEEDGDCEFIYWRKYYVVDECSLADNVYNNDINYLFQQDIIVNRTLKVEGPLKINYYDDYERTKHDNNHINTFNYLESQGLKYKINGYLNKNDIYIYYRDTWDDKFPGFFEREYTVCYKHCGECKITQQYEPSITNYIYLTPYIQVYKACEDIKSYLPTDLERIYKILEKYDTWNPEYISTLTFDYPPYNEYAGNLSHNVKYEFDDQGCSVWVKMICYFYYEYYGRIYTSLVIADLEFIRSEREEETIENHPFQTLELPNDTVYTCMERKCLPKPKETIDEFAEIGVENLQLCGYEDLISITYADDVVEENDCYAIYKRTYKIGDLCNGVAWYDVTQNIVMYKTLNVDGYIKTHYYTDVPPEPVGSYNGLVNLGAKIDYKGNFRDLEITYKDVEVEDVPDRIKRMYYVRTSCENVADSIQQYLVKKYPNDGDVFEMVEVNNVSLGGSSDGSLVLRVPSNELCTNCTYLKDAFEFILENYDGNKFEMVQLDKRHMIAENLPAGEYYLDVYPTIVEERNEPIYRFVGMITENKMDVAAVPTMSFSAYNFYVETFGYHYYYKNSPQGGGDDYVYIQNDKDSKWNYFFTVEGGKLINSIWDGDEVFSFYPMIQQNYESNSIVWKPGETIQLTMNSTYITFHAVNDQGKELTDRRIIYHSKICLSNDPNEIYGPAGYGEEHMINTFDRIDYKILFENDPDLATAAAARVKVTCPLHPHADPTTVRLGQYGFGDYIFDVPEMSTYYSKRHDLADSLGVWVDVSAGIDIDKNEMYWIFQSIDPETGVAPVDAIGFLPVNDTLTGKGEGFVTFSVLCIDGMMTGDTISEQANIIFDENDNIMTNVYTNTFDAVAPTSNTICDMSDVYNSRSLLFKTVAADDENGSGVRQVDLYVSIDNAQYQLAGSMYPDTISSNDTLGLYYQLDKGTLYQFKLQAIDNVGNKEPFADSAQIVFTNNNAPIDMYLSNNSFKEDDAAGTLIGEFSTLDDQTSDVFIYSFVDGENYDNDMFVIEGNKLKTNADFRCRGEYVYNIYVKTTDITGASFNKMFILFAQPTMTPSVTYVERFLCYGDFIEINNNIITEDGVYFDTLSTIYGCDSIVRYDVKHRPAPVTTYFEDFVCMNDNYNANGMNISWDSVQTYLAGWDESSAMTIAFKCDTVNYYGCVDTICLNLTVQPMYREVMDVVVCANEMPFEIGGEIFVESGTKEVVFTSVQTGCDSIVTVNLEVTPSYFDVPVFATICDNKYYMLFGDTIREAGTYYKMGESKHGCDSSVYLTLEVLPTSSGVDALSICASELPYPFGEYIFDESTVSGTYDVVFPTENGCDSIVALDLTVRQNGDQYNNFSASWDWFSTYIDDEGTDVMEELKTGLGQYAEMIKSSTEFITYSLSGGWLGSLNEIENEQMYMIKTKELQNTLINGCLASPEEHPINIKKGWNHIGYISQYSSDVNEALEGLDVAPQDGDIIKSYRDGFSVYFDAFDMWFGDLTTLQPGMGYQYMSNNDDDITLTYPQMTQNRTREIAKAELNWSPSYNYPDNMTFIADIVVDDWVCSSDTLEVGAFCNGEKRGNARAIYIKEIGAYRVFLTTYGNNGDELYFMLYDHESQEMVAQVSNQRVEFKVNETFGSLLNPYSFEFNTLYNTLIEDAICFGNTYEENGFNVSAEGSYFNKLKDNNGNDSIVKLKLNINPVYRIEENVLVKQFPYEYDGNWIEEPGVHTFNYTSVHGCDSIMVCSFMYETMELMLTPNPARQTERVMVLSNFTEEDKAGMVVEVFNAVGLKIHSIVPRRFPIELPEIDTSGSYTIRVVTGTGRVLTAKLIVM